MKTLKYHPFLIKPNRHELGEIFGVEISNKEDALVYAKKLQEQGAKNVLISMGKMGAVLLDEDGYAYKIKALDNQQRINTVGAGDSWYAGFISGMIDRKPIEECMYEGAKRSAQVISVFEPYFTTV